MRDFVSKIAKSIPPSGIRRFFDLAQGRKDIISLGVGEPDFITPWYIREAGISALKKGYTHYTSNKGLITLREEISSYLDSRFNVKFDKEQVVITMGASEAIDITLRAVLDAGDEVLIPDPSYVSYRPCVELCGAKAVSVNCSGDNGFILTPENLEKAVSEKTKVLIFPYPNNPTGAIMTKEDIDKIVPFIIKHDLLVVSDEIYSELTYGQTHYSICSDIRLYGRVVLISGFSKSFAMTGWRIGYVCAPENILKALLKIHQYTALCAPVFSQYAATEGLVKGKEENFQSVIDMREEYDARRKFLHKKLTDMGFSCFEPKGSFYIFPSVKFTGLNGEQFAVNLLNSKQVAVVPGGAFGQFGEDYIRISYAYSMKDLMIATDKIKEFIDEIK